MGLLGGSGTLPLVGDEAPPGAASRLVARGGRRLALVLLLRGRCRRDGDLFVRQVPRRHCGDHARQNPNRRHADGDLGEQVAGLGAECALAARAA